MTFRYVARAFVAYGVLGVCLLSPDSVLARRPWRAARVVPVEPVPVQPAPEAAPAPQPTVAPEKSPPTPAARKEAGRLIHGRNLIAMPIWGRNHERLGTVKDFVVDYQETCPKLFLAMAPDTVGWNEGYVIVPFESVQIAYDEGQKADNLFLAATGNDLHGAPHLQIERWNSIRDRQFLTEAGQFYRRFERTAARPQSDAGQAGRGRSEAETRQPADQKTPAVPPTPAPSGDSSGSRREPDARTPAPPPPPAPSTDDAPPTSRADRDRERGGERDRDAERKADRKTDANRDRDADRKHPSKSDSDE